MASALTFLMRYHTDGDAFLDQIVTGDETWVSHNTPETKHQSRQWHHPSSPKKPRKFKQTLSTQKVMATVFWDRFGSDEELKKTVNTWLNELAAEEYNTGILKLVNRYDKCLNVGGDYVEKEELARRSHRLSVITVMHVSSPPNLVSEIHDPCGANLGGIALLLPRAGVPLILLSKTLKVRIHKTVILPVVLYGCETWTLTLREEHRLRVFENKVLRKIFGAKRDEVTGEWRKLHNTELHIFYSSPNIIRNIKSRRMRWAGHVARMGESRNAYRVLVGRPEGKRPLGRPRRRWEGDIKIDLRQVGYDDREWINLAQDRDQWRAYVRAAMNLRVP
ncbi:hypothetical protein ANN_07539 [Periplaneta americana]|uniref:Uncharacterized protein n=1 Tax=Periplaneta americana TaxID=6978 RepID=A0ABQ8T0F2_PERAM|nr:hypothetical protein ANN_07539 [Periplaneta americana]